jgi:hypothetical protein
MKRSRIAIVSALVAASALPVSSAAADLLPPQMHTVAGGGSCTTPIVPPPATAPFALPCNGASATSVPIAGARWVAAAPGVGFLYVDERNGLVQQVSKGKVTTVAGGGSSCDYTNPGFACDGMPATAVKLDDPVAVAVLPGGAFLVTEHLGSRVLVVSAGPPGTATITTLAGTGTPGPDNGRTGPATSIPLNDPTDAEPTADGGVLVANSESNDIRDVAPDGTISTVAGGGTCHDDTQSCDGLAAGGVILSQPSSVSPIQGGSAGFLIAEYGDHAVRRVSQISPFGTFTTAAGTPGQKGFGGDGGPATGALLQYPKQVLSTPDGGFYIADSGNEVIRQVSPDGTITTVAGTPGPPGYAGDGGPASAASLFTPSAVSPTSGGVLIADEDNGVIREMTLAAVSTVSLSPASPNGGSGWYTSAPTAKVSATQGATVNCIVDPPQAPPAFGAIPAGCPFSGSGASVTGDGVHTIYAASMNSFGDQELPVAFIIKVDTTPPRVRCNGHPMFLAGAKHARVSATVSDQISGPANPTISARANTSRVGVHRADLEGANNAGFTILTICSYTVTPRNLKPTPRLTAGFAAARGGTTVKRLLVSKIPATAVVNLNCTGSACPFSSAVRVTGKECDGKPCQAKRGERHKRSRTIDLTALFARITLAAGDRLMVTVTAPNAVGRVWQFTMRAGKDPRHVTSCLEPGFSTPGKGCTSSSR